MLNYRRGPRDLSSSHRLGVLCQEEKIFSLLVKTQDSLSLLCYDGNHKDGCQPSSWRHLMGEQLEWVRHCMLGAHMLLLAICPFPFLWNTREYFGLLFLLVVRSFDSSGKIHLKGWGERGLDWGKVVCTNRRLHWVHRISFTTGLLCGYQIFAHIDKTVFCFCFFSPMCVWYICQYPREKGVNDTLSS